MPIPIETLNSIIEYGVKAPSGDNCQPWVFNWKGERLFVINDERRDTSLYNVKNIASLIAHGALLENMQIAAEGLGYEMTTVLFPYGDQERVVAEVQFKKATNKTDNLLPFIKKRCTNRWPYKRMRLDSHAMGLLQSTANEAKAGELFIVEDQKEKEITARAASLNDRLLFENQRLHDFLFDHIRWNREEAEATRDGMDIKTLGLSALQSRLFSFLKSWQVVTKLNLLGFSRLVPFQSYQLCKDSSALGLILMHEVSPKAFVLGGRLLERIWLTATSLGLAFQPMTGITFLIQRLYMEDGKELSDTHKRLIHKAEEELKKVFPIDKEKAMIMLFRIGYASPPPVMSLRRRIKIDLQGGLNISEQNKPIQGYGC